MTTLVVKVIPVTRTVRNGCAWVDCVAGFDIYAKVDGCIYQFVGMGYTRDYAFSDKDMANEFARHAGRELCDDFRWEKLDVTDFPVSSFVK